jgi:uncharacterized membrane protein YfcA
VTTPTPDRTPPNSGPEPRVRHVVDWELALWLVVAAVLGVLCGALFALVSR